MPVHCEHKGFDYPVQAEPSIPNTKTLDVGAFGKGVHASANAWGNILQINSTHEDHGVITATAFHEFRENLGDQKKVREYRKTLLLKVAPENGFGVILSDLPPLKTDEHILLEHFPMMKDDEAPVRSVYTCQNGITVTTLVTVTGTGDVRQIRYITTTSDKPVKFTWKVAGIDGNGLDDCHVSRASYGQLTEGGMIQMPQLDRKTSGDATDFSVESIDQAGPKPFATLRGQVMVHPALHEIPALGETVTTAVTKASPVTITSSFQLTEGSLKKSELQMPLSSDREISRSKSSPRPRVIDLADYIVWRNVDYMLNNCCISVKASAETNAIEPVCVITDHVALPLGWPRDNYWQLRPLMQLRAAQGTFPTSWNSWYSREVYEPKIDKALFGHINWVFRQADLHSTKENQQLVVYEEDENKVRVEKTKTETRAKPGFWARSYIINGKAKDTSGIFQLDQQCYPFLELCDFWKTYAGLESPAREKAANLVREVLGESTFRKVLGLLVDHIDEDMGLIKTDETPGDDDVEYGYLYSCNLLVWYTFVRLTGLLDSSEFEGQAAAFSQLELRKHAQKIRASMLKNMVKTIEFGGSAKEVFSYECGLGASTSTVQHVIYADGNDIPTLMTKKWKFVDTSEHLAVWHNTMRYMFDEEANGITMEDIKRDEEGNILNPARKTYWMGNSVKGLGSVHSENPWPLGIYQEYRYYTMCVESSSSKTEANTAKAKAQEAWNKLDVVMQWDGTFSEAVDPDNAQVTSKAYFSWPGAMIAGAIIEEHFGEF